MSPNDFKESIDPIIEVAVSKTNDKQALGFQPGLPLCIVLFFAEMRRTIEFNHEHRSRAIEVNDVNPDRMLPPELKTPESLRWQALPNGSLGVVGLAAHFASALEQKLAEVAVF